MILPDEMQHLIHDLRVAYDNRVQAITDIHDHVTQRLAEFQSGRQVMSAQQRQYLNEYMDAVHRNVSDLRHDAETFLKNLDTDHQQMASDQRQRLADHVDQLTHSIEMFQERLDTAHGQMATQQRQTLAAYMDGLYQNVSTLRSDSQVFLDELDADHQRMAREQQTRLTDYVSALRQHVIDSRHETQSLMDGIDAARQYMARQQRESLKASRTRLAAKVAAMRSTFQSEQNERRAAHQKSRRLWSNFATIRRRRGPQKTTVKAPATASSIAQQTLVKITPADDLTAIRGIGPRMKERLNAAGIFTADQLAHSSPEALRAGLGEAGRLAKVEQWIEQAQALTE